MTGLEYTDRLIEDIKKSAEIRAKVADPFTQIKQIGLGGKADFKDFLGALNVGNTEAHLDILSQFTNINDRLIDHTKGSKVDIAIFKRDVTKNREAIGKVFQQLFDNDNLIDLQTKSPISKFLKEQLEYIHQTSI